MKRLLLPSFFLVLLLIAACGQTGPTSRVEVQLDGQAQAENVYEGAVTVTLSASDPAGVPLALEYRLNDGIYQSYENPFEIDTPGEYTLRARARDSAGNIREAAPRSFRVVAAGEGPGPTVTIDLSGTESAPGVYTGAVTVTLSAEDNSGTGIASLMYALDGDEQAYAPFTVSEEGAYTLVARAVDNAGNETIAERSFQVVAASEADPELSLELSGNELAPGVYSAQVTVTIRAIDQSGTGLASTSYSLNGGSFQPYTGAFTVSGAGNYSLVARATDNAGNQSEETVAFRIGALPPSNARLVIENVDGMAGGELQPGFFHDWLTMSRVNDTSGEPIPEIRRDWTNLQNHDVATLRIRNMDTGAPLEIAALTISNTDRFIILPGGEDQNLPLTIPPGGAYELKVQFVETQGGRGVRRESLTIYSNDASNPTTVVQLAGAYMTRPEGNAELTLPQIAAAMGYNMALNRRPSELASSPLEGEEVRANFWTRADPSRPVYLRQIAAYHGCCIPEDRVQIINPLNGNTIAGFRHAGSHGQSMLPPISGSSGNPAEALFNPTTPFEMRVSNYSTYLANERNSRHVALRFYPVRDRSGALIANTYLVGHDYVIFGCGTAAANCDFQDNVYLLTNVQPLDAHYRLNVGGPAYQDSSGNVWLPDQASNLSELFSPANAPREPLNPPANPPAIAGTSDDVLYQSYRALIPGNPPMSQRVLAFSLPLGPGSYTVRLHFVELFWGKSGRPGAGQRVFDVAIEGNTVIEDLDIFSRVGSDTALVETFQGVQVSDGALDITLTTRVDFAAISAIEVIRTGP